MSRRAIVVVGAGVVLVAVFLLFRPDKLFVDDVVDESLEDAFGAVVDAAPPPTTVADEPEPASTSPTTSTTSTTSVPSTTTAPVGPVEVSSGSFFGIDHRAEGTATIYEQDGRHVLRFEDDTDIQNGPDLYVWVTTDTDWDDPGEYLDLGKLKGNIGGQNYELPPEFDPDVHRHVLIWCLRFTVPFAAVEMG